ncbi:hypothetical protein ATK36_4789 [Amycolatopsis sulphurea]|uniref:Uncharacterized protein n=1 Tax=Amycolatopsis sulphurea TaxID=76022 RepID=A0A2A9FDV2_9PSEU|nr:hypothetical protein ATK36_4789 [Amycolatopsis sulphurea]
MCGVHSARVVGMIIGSFVTWIMNGSWGPAGTGEGLGGPGLGGADLRERVLGARPAAGGTHPGAYAHRGQILRAG